jgi:DNA transposition AAA+ family ATPase
MRPYHERPDLAFVNKQNHPYFLDYCRKLASAELPWLLTEFCSKPDACISTPRYFHDLQGALIEAMDAHAARVNETIALTCVAEQCIDALEFARAEKSLVEIIGDSRFGKTEAVKTWCNAFPGQARLVKTPCDNSDRSLYEAIAEALGVEVTLRTKWRELKTTLEFILKHSGLTFVFDEAAWLIPQRYTAKTTPWRLNFIRSQMLENGCPVVIVTTPQFFGPAAHRFEKITGFNLTQWRGRVMRSVQLPAELPQKDLRAVVKIHFADLKESLITMIVSVAMFSDSYLFAVEKISRNARAVAKKNGHADIELPDLEEGIRLAGFNIPAVPPPRVTPPAAKPRPSGADPLPETPRSAATSAQLLGAPPREMRPVETTIA